MEPPLPRSFFSSGFHLLSLLVPRDMFADIFNYDFYFFSFKWAKHPLNELCSFVDLPLPRMPANHCCLPGLWVLFSSQFLTLLELVLFVEFCAYGYPPLRTRKTMTGLFTVESSVPRVAPAYNRHIAS